MIARRAPRANRLVHTVEPYATIERRGESVWEVRAINGEALGIGGPDPQRAWEAAAHYLGVAA